MSKLRWLLPAVVCFVGAMPTTSNAQTKKDPDDFIHDILGAMLKPNWNAFLHGGFATSDRYLLQRAPNPLDGERSLRSTIGFNFGGGAGVDILMHVGFRASYTFTQNDLEF